MKHLSKVVLAILFVTTINVRGVELLLTPIGLRFTIDPSDWGTVHLNDPPLPAQIEVQPHDNRDGFSYQLVSNGKGKMFSVETSLVKPGTQIIKPDISQFEAEFRSAGLNLNVPGTHKEIAKFLGQDSYKLTAEISSGSNPSLINSHILVYIFYANDLRYVVTALTQGTESPETEPALKDLLASLAFISDTKQTGALLVANSTPPATSSASNTPAIKPRSEPDLKSTIASFIILLKNGDYKTMMESYLAASTTIKWGKNEEMAFAKMSGTAETKKSMETMLGAMESIKDATPIYNDKGDQALFKNVTMPDGKTRQVQFDKINGFWYLDGF